MRDRFIDILNTELKNHFDYVPLGNVINIADNLLSNGVLAPPCKIGDKMYIVAECTKKVVEVTVVGVWNFGDSYAFITDYGTIHNNSIGETVFHTREEALSKLKGGVQE